MTIASEIEDLNTNLTAAKNAVTAKGGTVGDTGLAGLATEIASIPSGSAEVESKYIDFYDYDGTRLYSWTEQELADATELPANPSHAGLTADGWNWTLAELRAQGTPMDVGQMYHTTDGKTHLFVDVDADHLNPTIGIVLVGNATIDWGDNSTPDTITGSSSSTTIFTDHTYAAAGSYEATIEITSGKGYIVGREGYVSNLWKGGGKKQSQANVIPVKDLVYGSQLQEVWVGSNMVLGSSNSMQDCIPFVRLGFKRIVLPSTLTDSDVLPMGTGRCLFSYNNSLVFYAVPSGITFSAANNTFAFIASNVGALKAFSLPYSTTKLGYFTCNGRICIPKNVSTIYRVISSRGDIFVPEGTTTIEGVLYTTIAGYGDTIKYPSTITSGNFINNVSNALRPFVLDFSSATAVPTLTSGNYGASSNGLVIKVPAALEAEWKAAQNWSNYASCIVGV